jgi:catechol 2,3-dioxygenase-like lactoylglutathione lyase family enzyme
MPATVSPGGVFDHVAIAVSDLVASERFYGTVLSVLGVEPSHADAQLVEWEDWDIVPTDREHAVTRGLHVGFRARRPARPWTPSGRWGSTPPQPAMIRRRSGVALRSQGFRLAQLR